MRSEVFNYQESVRMERDFLLAREIAKNEYEENRMAGASADAMVHYAFGIANEPSPDKYPSDTRDLMACERVFAMAPKHMRDRMEPVLEKYRRHVSDSV